MNDFVISEGTLFEDFENIGEWSLVGTGASEEADIVNFKTGTQGLKLNMTGGNAASSTKTISLDLSTVNAFSFWVYLSDHTKITNIVVFFSSTTDFSKYFKFEFYNEIVQSGWNHFTPASDDCAVVGGESWNNTMIRIRVVGYVDTGQNGYVTFDNFRYNPISMPTVIINFDDGKASTYTKAYPILQANGQRAVSFINSSAIGIGGYMTLNNLTTLAAAGWDISNHTETHANLTTVTQEEMEAEVDNCYDWLVTNGFSSSARFFAYPWGLYNDAVIAKVKERHHFARIATASDYQAHWSLDDGDKLYFIPASYVENTTTPEEVIAWIDETIINNGVLILMFHMIVDADADLATEWLTADFQTVSDYLKTKEDAEDLQVITFGDYYEAITTDEFHVLQVEEDTLPEVSTSGEAGLALYDISALHHIQIAEYRGVGKHYGFYVLLYGEEGEL
jgi:peptidoglycan/xylan/chitin deacetylase (PgdA/CDA1 family)